MDNPEASISEGNATDVGPLVAMVQEAMRHEIRCEIAGLRADVAALRTDRGRRLDAVEAGEHSARGV
jgi:hypothetical protein